ncbi:hypothetical protein FHT76_006745 [Rhizobium sp. BK176]|nr:hypothetical protein [Rhizobium sp. BK181]MBB3542891.1 hypothetical protein [Rhizobium sp. BK399]MCS4095036.1 hypothetical protein [Rhizobium sp. BK176]
MKGRYIQNPRNATRASHLKCSPRRGVGDFLLENQIAPLARQTAADDPTAIMPLGGYMPKSLTWFVDVNATKR